MQLPKDFKYFRSSSDWYKKYLEKCEVYIIELENNCFWWMKKFFFNTINLAKFERIDEEPTKEHLKKFWFKRWLVIWIPKDQDIKPKWWFKVLIPTHFMKTWYTTLSEDYQKHWNSRAKRALKKFLKTTCEIKQVDENIFREAFKKAKVTTPAKYWYLSFHKSMCGLAWEKINNYLVYLENEAIAWLAVYDFDENSSVHLVAFHTQKAKDLQAGTGLMNKWFYDSFKKWLKYVNMDHLRDSSMATDQQWYTRFKMNFIENIIEFRQSYIKFFR